jgi:hypothetical protein
VTSTDTSDDAEEASGPNLVGRILVTWFELTLVATIGGALGGMVGGIPQIVVYTVTTIVSVAVLFYNVDQLISEHVAAAVG